MKELKPKITDIRAKRRSKDDQRLASRKASSFTNKVESCKPSPLQHSLPAPKHTLTASKATAIAPLQPQQLALEQSLPKHRSGWQRLAAQAELINKLAAELEEAMFELKAIANDINCNRRKQNTQKPIKHACEYLAVIVPHVKYKTGAFVLTNRPVDLFRPEREATQLAQTLRNRAKKRRVSPLSRRNKHPLLGWLS